MKLTNINQLWVADIAYIRLESEFVYPGVILDASLAPRDRVGSGPHTEGEAHSRRAEEGPLLISINGE